MSEQTPRDDLVERLRDRHELVLSPEHCLVGPPINPDGPEAADRIERLERALVQMWGALEPLVVAVDEGRPSAVIVHVAKKTLAALKGQEG